MALWRSIRRDIQACLDRDPAARSRIEVCLTYPGFHARLFHRLAHTLWNRGIPLLPRVISHIGRGLTGIEIHPGAQIGEGLFIDHGMGVVIGETTIIGDDCTLYQGVTLGGVSRKRIKRHPTLGNRVIIGSGAQLLGSIEIGDDVKVGAGSVVVQPVPAYATVVGVPGRVVAIRNADSGTMEKLPDPMAEAVLALKEQLHDIKKRLAALEGEHVEPHVVMAAIEDILGRITVAQGDEARQ